MSENSKGFWSWENYNLSYPQRTLLEACLLTLGIDPGPRDYSWAVYEEVDNFRSILRWGTCDLDKWPENPPRVVAIERVVSYGGTMARTTTTTCENVGRIAKMFEFLSCKVYLIPRKTIATRITGNPRSGDRMINLYVARLVPEFGKFKKGTNQHHRAAAACAIVGYGLHQAQTSLELAR